MAVPVNRLIQISDYLLRIGKGEIGRGGLRLRRATCGKNGECKAECDFAKKGNLYALVIRLYLVRKSRMPESESSLQLGLTMLAGCVTSKEQLECQF